VKKVSKRLVNIVYNSHFKNLYGAVDEKAAYSALESFGQTKEMYKYLLKL